MRANSGLASAAFTAPGARSISTANNQPSGAMISTSVATTVTVAASHGRTRRASHSYGALTTTYSATAPNSPGRNGVSATSTAVTSRRMSSVAQFRGVETTATSSGAVRRGATSDTGSDMG